MLKYFWWEIKQKTHRWSAVVCSMKHSDPRCCPECPKTFCTSGETPKYLEFSFGFSWSGTLWFLWWEVTAQLTCYPCHPWEHFPAKSVALLINIPVTRVILLIIILTKVLEQVSPPEGHDKSPALTDTKFIRHFFFVQYCIYLLSQTSSF